MQLTGAQILIECLKEQGVDTVFGYPGGAILNVYDELYKHRDEIRHILTSHEQGASHAADGYARLTGKIRRMFCDERTGSDQPGNRNTDCLYGFDSACSITCNVNVPLLGQIQFSGKLILRASHPRLPSLFLSRRLRQSGQILRRAFTIAKKAHRVPGLVKFPNMFPPRTTSLP